MEIVRFIVYRVLNFFMQHQEIYVCICIGSKTQTNNINGIHGINQNCNIFIKSLDGSNNYTRIIHKCYYRNLE